MRKQQIFTLLFFIIYLIIFVWIAFDAFDDKKYFLVLLVFSPLVIYPLIQLWILSGKKYENSSVGKALVLVIVIPTISTSLFFWGAVNYVEQKEAQEEAQLRKDFTENCSVEDMTLSINPYGSFSLRGRIINKSEQNISSFKYSITIVSGDKVFESREVNIDFPYPDNVRPSQVRNFEKSGDIPNVPSQGWSWNGDLISINHIQLIR